MRPLTRKFVQKQGFVFEGVTFEEDAEPAFNYEEYVKYFEDIYIAVYFNHFEDGNSTIEVLMEGKELVNVGKDELLTLIKIIPHEQNEQ